MKSADNLRKAIGMVQELRKLLDSTPNETMIKKVGGNHPISMLWFVEDALDDVEDALTKRLKHVEVVGRVTADRIEEPS